MIGRLSTGFALITFAFASGCALNTSPFHSDLSDAQTDARLRSRFTIGMSGTDAMTKLNRAGLEHSTGPIPPRDSSRESDWGVRADVPPPGFRYAFGFIPNYKHDAIYLWFTADDRLEQLGYERSPVGDSPPDTELGLRIVPLSEEPTE